MHLHFFLYTQNLPPQIKYKVTPFINQSTTLKNSLVVWLYGLCKLGIVSGKPINQESPPPLLVNCYVVFPIKHYLSF